MPLDILSLDALPSLKTFLLIQAFIEFTAGFLTQFIGEVVISGRKVRSEVHMWWGLLAINMAITSYAFRNVKASDGKQQVMLFSYLLYHAHVSITSLYFLLTEGITKFRIVTIFLHSIFAYYITVVLEAQNFWVQIPHILLY